MNRHGNQSQLELADSLFLKIFKEVDWLSLFTPVNIVNERKTFIDSFRQGKVYNPLFKYNTPKIPLLNSLKHELTLFNLEKYVPAMLFNDYNAVRKYLIGIIEMISAFSQKDDARVSQLSKRIFGFEDQYLLSSAKETLGVSVRPIQKEWEIQSDIISPTLFADKLKQCLNKYGIDWQVQVTDQNVARVSVNPQKETINVRSDVRYTQLDLQKLIVHEIETHVLRMENGKRCWLPSIFEIGFFDNEAIDEGLAMFNERSVGIALPDSDRLIALHIVGQNIASMCSFYETFEHILPYFPNDPEYAFQRVLRWKRGLHSQALHGAFFKDCIYFRGLKSIEQYVDKGGNLGCLYYGNVNLSHTESEWREIANAFMIPDSPSPILPSFIKDTI